MNTEGGKGIAKLSGEDNDTGLKKRQVFTRLGSGNWAVFQLMENPFLELIFSDTAPVREGEWRVSFPPPTPNTHTGF